MQLPDQVKEKVVNKPSFFVDKVLGVEPYDYQKHFLDHDSPRRVLVGGRQIGKTTMLSWLAIHRFATQPDNNVLIIAPTQRQVWNFIEKLKTEISEWLDNPDQYGIEYESKSEIRGTNGSKIFGLPAAGKGDTIRGFTVDTAIVDEAAFVDDEIYTSALRPMLFTTDGEFILSGTPWGQEGYFYKKFDEARDDEVETRWVNFQVSTIQNPDVPSEEIEEARRELSNNEFEREILGQFTDKQNAFFKNATINYCLDWAADYPDNVVYPDQETRKCFMGVDVASGGDARAVFTTIDAKGNIFDIEQKAQCELPEVEGTIKNKIRSSDRNYMTVLIEENGLGEGPVQSLERQYRSVKGFRTTIRSKESIYSELKEQMQKGNVALPDISEYKKELRSMEYEMTSGGNQKIYAPGRKNDDFADSLALAFAAKSNKNHTERASRAFEPRSNSQRNNAENNMRFTF